MALRRAPAHRFTGLSLERLNRALIVAFVTGPEAETRAYLERVAEFHPDSKLLVASSSRPAIGEWVEIHPGQGVGAIRAAVRRAIGTRTLDTVAIHATRGSGKWRMRLAAVLLGGRRLRIFNDNLDHFPLGNLATLRRHLQWRWSQRRRGALLWSVLARAALAAPALATIPKPAPDAPKLLAPLEPGISLVIPTRDGRDLLTAMLPGVIADLAPRPVEIIVVDNGSSDGTEAFLRDRYPWVKSLVSAAPLSFAQAVNRGIDAARYSHVVLLNNDMQIQPGFFAALRRAFDRVPDLFCATAQIFFPPGQRREETGLCFWRQIPGDDFPVYCDQPRAGEDGTLVLYGSGGCSMYDTAKLRALGRFDEIYQPAYVEDLDIGYRAWQRGWPTVFCSQAQVEHHHRATTSRYYDPDYLDYLVERNYLRFLLRATGDIFPELWRDAITRLENRAVTGDKAARRALRSAWREAFRRIPVSSPHDERKLKSLLTR